MQSLAVFLLVAGALSGGGCGEDTKVTVRAEKTAKSPTVASLVPAATDMIVGMGAGDHLVAISNWDPKRPEFASLPRVGDYRSADWEQLAHLRPQIMIVQYHPDKMPAGLMEKAQNLRIKVVNVRLNRLSDVFDTVRQLGDALNEVEKGNQLADRIKQEAIESVDSGPAPVPTLIVRSASGLDVVGGGNFMDDILTAAGGKNVMEGGDNSYPTIDREMLLKLDPQVILHLLPGESPQVVNQAKDFWKNLPQLQAVRNNRIHVFTEDYVLLPGANVGKTIQLFRNYIHGRANP